jgi:serine/threonine protein kinase
MLTTVLARSLARSACLPGLESLHKGSQRLGDPFSGMDYYLHRDIKPENVLLGADGYAMLADFGFACRLVHNQRTYSQVGTSEYMAPELVLAKGYDQCADYW